MKKLKILNKKKNGNKEKRLDLRSEMISRMIVKCFLKV